MVKRELKKVLYLALSFPNVKKTTHLYTDLMHEFLNQGHEVVVVAPDEEGQRKKSELVEESGMFIVRVPTLNLFSNSKYIKGLSNVLLPFQFKRAIKKHIKEYDFDLIIIPTPPITLIDIAFWIKRKCDAKLYLILRDIFPQNAVDLKMIGENGILHKYFRKKEKKLYQQSDSIGCMSPANIDYVKEHNDYVDTEKLHLLPNWENLHGMEEELNEEGIREKYGLKNKLIAIFGGNIGLPQRMENIIHLAESCRDLSDLVFFIIGRGTERDKIAQMVKDASLSNVIIKGNVPRPEYIQILRISDIGLISLSQDFTIPNYPSKVNAYYAHKKPVLASVDINTDFGRIQEEIGCGFWAEAGNTEELKKKLLKLYDDKELRQEMGMKGNKYFLENLMPKNAYDIIHKEVSTI